MANMSFYFRQDMSCVQRLNGCLLFKQIPSGAHLIPIIEKDMRDSLVLKKI